MAELFHNTRAPEKRETPPAERDDERIARLVSRLRELGCTRIQTYYEDGDWFILAEDSEGNEAAWNVRTGRGVR
jgi:predicted alpha-1,6-mannanase (GH76 family)